jgi:glucosamine--fructose-6-phosphate aminotransferase (isomerizing)
MYLLALYMGRTRGVLSDDEYRRVLAELAQTPDKLSALLADEPKIRDLAKKIYKNERIFFIGRGSDVSVALEGSLKLKEISYIHSFAIAAGELKHGTIALIEQDSLVVALASQDRLFEKLLSNIEEVKARGARVIGLAKAGNRRIEELSDEAIYIPACADDVTPILAIVPLQLLAYHVAKLRGCDIDKPKNLAKSVTVE